MTPRVLLAIGRDGLFTAKAAAVSAGGTPRVALAFSSAAAVALILSGTFEQIIALATVLFLVNYVAVYLAVFVLRRREPDLPRALIVHSDFPYTTGIVCAGSVLALIAAVAENTGSALAAALLLAACAPIYGWVARRKRLEGAQAAAESP